MNWPGLDQSIKETLESLKKSHPNVVDSCVFNVVNSDMVLLNPFMEKAFALDNGPGHDIYEYSLDCVKRLGKASKKHTKLSKTDYLGFMAVFDLVEDLGESLLALNPRCSMPCACNMAFQMVRSAAAALEKNPAAADESLRELYEGLESHQMLSCLSHRIRSGDAGTLPTPPLLSASDANLGETSPPR